MYHPIAIQMQNQLENEKGDFVGATTFRLGSVTIDVESTDGIGGLIQEWLQQWVLENGYDCRDASPIVGTQEFPDFFIGDEAAPLEIKTFNSKRSPSFDIANFESYHESISENPSRLDADYLIFGYEVIDDGFRITNVWLKKIWQITCPSERYPLKTQIRRDTIYNIRPGIWYSENVRYSMFSNVGEFVTALNQTKDQYDSIRE